jgi:hypothetical protein
MDPATSPPPTPPPRRSPPPPVTSPFAGDEDDEPPNQDYNTQLNNLLNGSRHEDEEDEENGFGEFVYAGVDVEAEAPEEDEAYGDQLADVLGSAASATDGASSTGAPNHKEVPDINMPVESPVCREGMRAEGRS